MLAFGEPDLLEYDPCPPADFQVEGCYFRSHGAVFALSGLLFVICTSRPCDWPAHLVYWVVNETLRLIPHARAGDATLRFDYAALRAVPPADKPFGAPHLFTA